MLGMFGRKGLKAKQRSDGTINARSQYCNERWVYALLGTYERKTIEIHRTINEATRMQIALNTQ